VSTFIAQDQTNNPFFTLMCCPFLRTIGKNVLKKTHRQSTLRKRSSVKGKWLLWITKWHVACCNCIMSKKNV